MQASAATFAQEPLGHNFVLRVPLAKANANKCARSDCGADIRLHARSEVTDEQLLTVIQCQDDGKPSVVYDDELAVGSYKAALAVCKEPKETSRTVVLNCAGQRLHEMLPLTRAPFDRLRSESPPRLFDLEWEDSEHFSIPLADVIAALGWAREQLSRGHMVLVNCAQGKSRSGTMATAYVMARLKVPVADALARIRAVRPLVQPNPAFMRALREFEAAIHEQPSPVLPEEVKLRSKFATYDTDGSGGLNLKELRMALLDYGESANGAKALLEEFDGGGKGELSTDEFVHAWRSAGLGT